MDSYGYIMKPYAYPPRAYPPRVAILIKDSGIWEKNPGTILIKGLAAAAIEKIRNPY